MVKYKHQSVDSQLLNIADWKYFLKLGGQKKRQPWFLLCYLGVFIDLATFHKAHIGLFPWSKHYLVLFVIPSFSPFLSSSLEFLNLKEENSFALIHKIPPPQILRTFSGIEDFNSTSCYTTLLKQRKLLKELAWGVSGNNKGNVKPGFQLRVVYVRYHVLSCISQNRIGYAEVINSY